MRYPVLLIAGLSLLSAQTPAPKSPPTGPDPMSVAKLLETGHCSEGLPLAKKAYSRAANADLKRRMGAGGVRCAMSLNDTGTAADLIGMLNRDFPRDPDILYLAVHTYSDLSLRASQTLLFTNPAAYQVHQLNAEAMEAQEKWEEAAEEYRMVLKTNPKSTGNPLPARPAAPLQTRNTDREGGGEEGIRGRAPGQPVERRRRIRAGGTGAAGRELPRGDRPLYASRQAGRDVRGCLHRPRPLVAQCRKRRLRQWPRWSTPRNCNRIIRRSTSCWPMPIGARAGRPMPIGK